MSIEKEIKQEASIPLQSRVDVRTLAEWVKLWEEKGIHIRTMSQLVSWSLDLLLEVIRESEGEERKEMRVADAYREMTDRGLMQKSMAGRTNKKMAAAIRLESLRERGMNPRETDKRDYDMLHRRTSVEPFVSERRGRGSGPDIAAMTDMYRKIESGEIDINKETETSEAHIKEGATLDKVRREVREEKSKEDRESFGFEKDGKFHFNRNVPKDKSPVVRRGMTVSENNAEGESELDEVDRGYIKEGMSLEELNERQRKRDEEIRERENQPLDLSQMEIVKEEKDSEKGSG